VFANTCISKTKKERQFLIGSTPGISWQLCNRIYSSCTIAKQLEVVAEIFPLESAELCNMSLFHSSLNLGSKSHVVGDGVCVIYPRDAMLALVIAIVTCLSVCPSVTSRYCVKTKKASVKTTLFQAAFTDTDIDSVFSL